MQLIKTVFNATMLAMSVAGFACAYPSQNDPKEATAVTPRSSDRWESNACTLSLDYKNDTNTYASLVIRAPSFDIFDFRLLQQDYEDITNKYLLKGPLHVNKGKVFEDFWFTYDNQKVHVPSNSPSEVTLGGTLCTSYLENVIQCDLSFNCTGTDALASKDDDPHVFQRRKL
ncbi:hypothetical protein AAP_04337 [Ascosphaera apis ARSEF 7405]|uniref:Uncharacterized protein n=1 Tax=Ascosphaera apis ARSEF 7405 TaxID=392613 RepID=A0A167X3C6_9EURO|nr:hypothetical protein AAP_04337 [Ascosphaera apis ARSEF 7405]